MAYEHTDRQGRCKGCGLCVAAAPRTSWRSGHEDEHQGYFPAYQARPEDCIFCAICCTMCPDVAITINEMAEAAAGKAKRGNEMGKVLMKGNEAIAEAAIRAGCLELFRLPDYAPNPRWPSICPNGCPRWAASSCRGRAKSRVSYMIFGASACGARVFTTSSSPGISLMSEGISYITAAQCPARVRQHHARGPGLGGILPSRRTISSR